MHGQRGSTSPPSHALAIERNRAVAQYICSLKDEPFGIKEMLGGHQVGPTMHIEILRG